MLAWSQTHPPASKERKVSGGGRQSGKEGDSQGRGWHKVKVVLAHLDLNALALGAHVSLSSEEDADEEERGRTFGLGTSPRAVQHNAKKTKREPISHGRNARSPAVSRREVTTCNATNASNGSGSGLFIRSQVESSLDINNRQPDDGSLSNVLRRPAVVEGSGLR